MTNKKVLERKLIEKDKEIDGLLSTMDSISAEIDNIRKERDFLDDTTKVMQESIDELRTQASMKQTIFLTANVDAYPTKEAKDEIMTHVRERMDSELDRLKMPVQAVVLPDIVKTIMVHDMKE